MKAKHYTKEQSLSHSENGERVPFAIGPDPVLIRKEILADGPGIDAYRSIGGYEGLTKAVRTMTPHEVIAEVKDAGLRGRGGSGFPAALKWEKVASHRVREHYVVANGSEGEPGSHKDHFLITTNPHQILEGIIIASFAVSAKKALLFVKESFPEGVDILKRARLEAIESGYLGENILGSGFSVDVEIFVGPAAYIAGEETALLESLEGRPPKPRTKPPHYPTERGLYLCPTVVNNVETYAQASHILKNGAEWFRKRGTPKSPGTMVFAVTGSVKTPMIVELPLGTPLRELVFHYGGGPLPGEEIVALYPGGPSFGVLPAKHIDAPLEYDALRALGSGIGSGGAIVLSNKDCLIATSLEFARFYEKGSCGQCPPCRIGTETIADLLEQIETGKATAGIVDRIQRVSEMIKGRGNCGLITASAFSAEALMKHFKNEVLTHIEKGTCVHHHRTPVYNRFQTMKTSG